MSLKAGLDVAKLLGTLSPEQRSALLAHFVTSQEGQSEIAKRAAELGARTAPAQKYVVQSRPVYFVPRAGESSGLFRAECALVKVYSTSGKQVPKARSYVFSSDQLDALERALPELREALKQAETALADSKQREEVKREGERLASKWRDKRGGSSNELESAAVLRAMLANGAALSDDE